jgi:energy-converting hydrogenase Eha subunit F
MPEKTDTNKTEPSRPTEKKRVDTASKQPLAPYQQEAAPEFYPKEVIEAEPKGEESVGEHHEQLAEIARENDDAAGTSSTGDNRGGALDGVSSQATRKDQKKRA